MAPVRDVDILMSEVDFDEGGTTLLLEFAPEMPIDGRSGVASPIGPSPIRPCRGLADERRSSHRRQNAASPRPDCGKWCGRCSASPGTNGKTSAFSTRWGFAAVMGRCLPGSGVREHRGSLTGQTCLAYFSGWRRRRGRARYVAFWRSAGARREGGSTNGCGDANGLDSGRHRSGGGRQRVGCGCCRQRDPARTRRRSGRSGRSGRAERSGRGREQLCGERSVGAATDSVWVSGFCFVSIGASRRSGIRQRRTGRINAPRSERPLRGLPCRWYRRRGISIVVGGRPGDREPADARHRAPYSRTVSFGTLTPRRCEGAGLTREGCSASRTVATCSPASTAGRRAS